MKPVQTETGNSIRFEWDDVHVVIRVSRVREHSDGRVTAEILTTTSAPGYAPHLDQRSVNLLTSKAGFAKELAAIYEADWPTMLEQVKVYTLEWLRKGEPVMDLLGEEESEPPTYLINPLIVEGYPNVIFGDPGCFKSGLAIVIAAVLTLPWTDNPLLWPEPAKPTQCLYLDWETDSKTVNWTHSRLRRGHKFGAFPIHYRRCFAPLFNDIEAVTELADTCEAKVVIIDSLGMASGNDDLNSSLTATNFYRGLRQLNRTSIILAHNAKDRERKERSIYGNQYFTAQARNIWEVRKVQETGEDSLDLGLFHRKAPPFARFSKPLGMHVAFQDSSITVEAKRADSIRELLSEMSLREQIYDLLAHEGAQTLDEITKALQANRDSVKTTLNRMKNNGVAIPEEGKKWGLLASPSTT